MRSLVLVSVWLVFAACSNLHSVLDGDLYRSAQLSRETLRDVIDEKGVRTVVRLRGGQPGTEDFEQSRGPTDDAGIGFVHIPMTATSMPQREVLTRLWRTFDSAERPILVHCQAGADRSGLASALFVLHETGDLRAAKQQLHTFPYLHTGWGRTDAMDRVLEQYEPYQGALDFGLWAADIYDPTEGANRP